MLNELKDLIQMNLQLFAEDGDDDKLADEIKDDINIDDDKKTDSDVTEVTKTDKDIKTFTQAELTKMMTKEKNQGRSAVLKEFGIDPKDTKAIAMIKAMIESQKTTEEKESEVQTKVIEAEQRAMMAEAKVEALSLGVQSQYVDDVITLAISKTKDDGNLKETIEGFKVKYPVWFATEKEADKVDDKKNVGRKGTGSSIKGNKENDKGTTKSLGERLAAQRRGKETKKSYWGN